MQAPPAANVATVIKLGSRGGIEHIRADEESKTEHEFYIICAALSVRSILAFNAQLHAAWQSALASRFLMIAFAYYAGQHLQKLQRLLPSSID